jgi:hypothetical protein
LDLQLGGEDRLGIVSNSKTLAERGISIDSIYTDIVRSGVSTKQILKVPIDVPRRIVAGIEEYMRVRTSRRHGNHQAGKDPIAKKALKT